MAVTIDVGNPKDIHPKDKETVGIRLALLALKDTYGKKDIVAYSPTATKISSIEGKLVVTFKNVAAGLISTDSKPIREFEIAGKDGDFKPAIATISSKDEIALSSAEVQNPTQVRYAWTNTPSTNLANKSGLPAPCFKLNL